MRVGAYLCLLAGDPSFPCRPCPSGCAWIVHREKDLKIVSIELAKYVAIELLPEAFLKEYILETGAGLELSDSYQCL